jgi:type IV secretion system protein VirD4
MELDMLGDQRTAMFVIISDTDDTFNFIVAIMYTQLFNLLCDRADDVHGGRLPYHVRLLLDEFANSDDTFYAENGRNNRQKRSLKSQII